MIKCFKIINIIFIIFLFNTINLFSQINSINNELRLAKSFELRGKLEEAEEIYSNLHKKTPVNYQYYSFLQKNLVAQKKYDEALELIQNQIKISKRKVNLYGDMGSIYFLLGREEEASEIWEEALQFEPNNAFAYRTIANYQIENRLLESAIEVLKRGNQVSDDKTIFSYDIANFYSITMKFKEATEEYCNILEQKPKQISLIKNKIIAYINSNHAEDPTLKAVRERYNDDENIIHLRLLAELYFTTNNRNEAFEATVKIEEETTNNGSAIFAFAQQSVRIGDYKIAALAYDKIIDDFSNSALISEAEIGYTKSLESALNRKLTSNEQWKPLVIAEIIDTTQYQNLISAYQNLIRKYHDNKVGWESEFRIAKIYQNNLYELNKADSIYNKILDETRTLQYIDESHFGLAEIAIQNGEIDIAEIHLDKISKSRMASKNLKTKAIFLLAKTKMWKGEFSNSIKELNIVSQNPKEEIVNDALEYSLLLNTFKNDSINLFSYVKSDYLVETNNFDGALAQFKGLAENENLFLLKDFASLRYVELLLALNNYKEAGIFLEEISNCDEDNIYKDRFLYLLGSNYYYGLNDNSRALEPLTRIFEEFPNSIYYNKARIIISEINAGVGNTL